MTINDIIENCKPIHNDIMRFGAVVSLHNKQEYIDSNVYTVELVTLFESEPYGETEKYQWVTRKVDQLINVHIWRK